MSAFPNMLAYMVSRDAVILYAYIMDSCDAHGTCRGVYSAGASGGLEIAETKAALKDLVDKHYVEEFTERVPIAEISGGVVYGSCVGCRILNFSTPLIHNRLSAEAWDRIRNAVFKRDNYTCCYCGARGGKLECDHLEPISKGGTNELGNLVTACLACNRAKRTKLLSEWRDDYGEASRIPTAAP